MASAPLIVWQELIGCGDTRWVGLKTFFQHCINSEEKEELPMMLKSLRWATVAVSMALLGASASADTLKFGKPDDAIKYRQNAKFVMSQHFGALGAMANGRAPFDAQVAQQNGAALEVLATLPWQGFDQAQEGGKAKPETWKEKAKFDGLAQDYMAQAAKLAAAAKTGDLANLKAAFGPAAQTCKACHDVYRNR